MRRITKKLTIVAMSVFTLAAIGISFAPTVSVSAAVVDPKAQICAGSGGTPGTGGTNAAGNPNPACSGQTGTNDDLGAIFKTIVNVLLYIIGALAVIVIVIGGLRYVTSAGNASSVTAAKNTILYAVVGLVIAVLAYAIVNFVLGALF